MALPLLAKVANDVNVQIRGRRNVIVGARHASPLQPGLLSDIKVFD